VTREEIAAYVVAIEADTTKYKKGIQQASEDTKRVADQMRKHAEGAEVFGKVIDNLGTKMSNMAGQFRAMAAIESPFGFVKHGVSLGAEAEQMEISFGTMLRSADKGRELVKDLQKFAADTPMTLQGLQQNAKMLLQFGVSGSQIIPTLQKLGDVTGGDADKMARMTLGFGQMMSAGRVLGEELNQMREAGFNPLLTLAEDMAKKFGGPVSEHMATLQTQLAAGAIKVSDVERAFKIATSEGGQFFGLMQKQSQSFNGLMSTMHDDVDALKRSVGKSVIELFYLKDGLKAVSDAAQDLTKRYDELSNRQKEIVSSLAILAFGFGALIVTWKVGAIAGGMIVGVLRDMVITFGSVTAGIRAHVAAMGVMGTTIAALKLGIIGLSGVIVVMGAKALVKLSEDANGTTEALRKLNDERERGAKLNSDLAGSNLYNPHRAILKEASEYRTEIERWKFIASKSGEVEKQLKEANEAVETTQAGIDRLLDTPARKARSEIKQFAKAGRFGEQNSPLAVVAGIFGEGALTDSQNAELKSRKDQLASPEGDSGRPESVQGRVGQGQAGAPSRSTTRATSRNWRTRWTPSRSPGRWPPTRSRRGGTRPRGRSRGWSV
jgi:tape measure domain-containing protein